MTSSVKVVNTCIQHVCSSTSHLHMHACAVRPKRLPFQPLLATALCSHIDAHSLPLNKPLTSEYVVESVPDVVAPGDVCGVGQVFRLPAEVLGEHSEETEDKEWSCWKNLTNTQCVFDGHLLQLSSSNGPSIQIRDKG